MMKKTNGITLVALIITVIVMLILVAVTVSVVINSNLIGTAQNAADRTEQAYEQEGNMSEIKINGKTYASMEDYKNGVQKILDDSLPGNEYLKTFITEWTVEAGDTITLPIYEKQEINERQGEVETYFNYNFTVDYGDGTIAEITSFDDEDRIHTYTTAGTYKVKIDGQCEAWSFETVVDSADKITKLEQWGVVQAKHIDFHNCVNLIGEIPVPSLSSFNEVISLRRLFSYCTSLTSKIPANLFQHAEKVVTLANGFCYSGITGEIPEDLLANCKELTNVRYLFEDAENLTGSIPENLLNRCNKLITVEGMFAKTVNLKGSIPAELFKGCTQITLVNEMFKYCEWITGEIPEELFADCNLIERMTNCFNGCTGITGEIPSNLFIGKTQLISIQNCFRDCYNLEDSEITLESMRLNENSSWFYNSLGNVKANITIYIPKGINYTAANFDTSKTANITIIEYELE